MRHYARVLILCVALAGGGCASRGASAPFAGAAGVPSASQRLTHCEAVLYRDPDPVPAEARACAYLLDAWQ